MNAQAGREPVGPVPQRLGPLGDALRPDALRRAAMVYTPTSRDNFKGNFGMRYGDGKSSCTSSESCGRNLEAATAASRGHLRWKGGR